MSKLWKKTATKLNPLIEKYTVGEDYLLDTQLMPYDIQATKAHIKGLEKIGILNKGELKKLTARLNKLEKEFKAGKVKIRIQDEDCHTVIENYVTKKYKRLGQKVHTGRSRNDQVLVALRLFQLDNLREVKKEAKKLAKSLLDFANEHKNIPMPGYTHTQQAMLSSVGHYFLSYTESLIDDIEFLSTVEKQLNKNPLGSAAGFGVPLLLDREFTKRELKFKLVQVNSLYCQSSRGKFESLYLEALSQIMLTLNKFASDIILFTSQEFNYFKVKSSLTTGSSIMPQKKNHDALEILRGQTTVVINNQKLIKDLTKNLISGYHRDLQLIKKPLFKSTDITKDSLAIVSLYLKGIKPQEKAITEKITKDIFMADLATEMAKDKKIPFRTAYKKAFKEIKKYSPDLAENIKSKISLGAPGNLDIHHYLNRLKKL